MENYNQSSRRDENSEANTTTPNQHGNLNQPQDDRNTQQSNQVEAGSTMHNSNAGGGYGSTQQSGQDASDQAAQRPSQYNNSTDDEDQEDKEDQLDDDDDSVELDAMEEDDEDDERDSSATRQNSGYGNTQSTF